MKGDSMSNLADRRRSSKSPSTPDAEEKSVPTTPPNGQTPPTPEATADANTNSVPSILGTSIGERINPSPGGVYNIVQYWGGDDEREANQPLEVVRLDANETAVVPFSTDGEAVSLHYCEHKEIGGYVHCNGPDCVLCRCGRKAEERLLLPVYLPATGAVGVLPISPNSRAGALRPQLLPILRSGRRVALLITRPDRAKFTVSTIDLTADMDDGAAVIKSFLGKWQAGEVKLASVFPRLDNRTLADIPGVASMAKLKGITVHDDAHRQ
jgi:hypothetical protein